MWLTLSEFDFFCLLSLYHTIWDIIYNINNEQLYKLYKQWAIIALTSVVKIQILNDQKLYYTLKVGTDKKNTLLQSGA